MILGLLFLLLVLAVFLLPLLPAISEWRSPTDQEPLKVVRDYDGDVRHFATGFRRYVHTTFGDSLTEVVPENTNPDLVFQVMSAAGMPDFSAKEMQDGSSRKLVLSKHALSLPDGMLFESEMFGAGGIASGRHNQFRALLSDGDIRLQDQCTVLRWAHSAGMLIAGKECNLFGRASADKGMQLAEGCTFERLHSTCIVFGSAPKGGLPPVTTEPVMIARGLAALRQPGRNVRDFYGRRWLMQGRVDISPRTFFDGDIVSGKGMHIGAGAHIRGSIKSNGDCVLEAGVIIEGSVVCTRDLIIGPGCRIRGPVIAERVLKIETGTIIGAENTPTSVTAPDVQIELDVAVYGTVWATEQGSVIAPKQATESKAA